MTIFNIIKTNTYLALIYLFFSPFKLILASPIAPGTIDDINEQSFFTKFKAGFLDSSIGEVVATTISAFLGLLGLIFLILIIHSGFLWMTAGGNSQQVEKAKSGIIKAIIGLVIIISAYSIMFFVFKNLPI